MFFSYFFFASFAFCVICVLCLVNIYVAYPFLFVHAAASATATLDNFGDVAKYLQKKWKEAKPTVGDVLSSFLETVATARNTARPAAARVAGNDDEKLIVLGIMDFFIEIDMIKRRKFGFDIKRNNQSNKKLL